MPSKLAGAVRDQDLKAHSEVRSGTAARPATVATLLSRRFGEDPRIPGIAERLAKLSKDRAVDAALSASSLDTLAHA